MKSFFSNHRVLLTAAMIALSGAAAAAGPVAAVGPSTLSFEATGPAGLKINGESGGLQATEEGGKYVVVAPTTDFKTGIGLRDKHLRKALDADAHPRAKLEVDKSAIKLPASGSSKGKASGDLTLHGVKKPTTFNYEIKKDGDNYQIVGDFQVNIHDYNLEKPCYLGVCVEELVKVSVKMTVHGP
jgi:polyisoprenoid-binding protein YceI